MSLPTLQNPSTTTPAGPVAAIALAEQLPADTWLSNRFGGLPRMFWVLFAGVGVARLGFFVIPFRVFYLSHERHLPPVQASLVMTAFGLGWALSQPVGGWCADRLNRRTVVICSAWGSAGAFLAFGSATTVVGLAITACLAGLTFDAYRPAVQALMTDHVSPHSRARALALLYLTMNMGRGVACIMAGLLAEKAFWLLFVVNAVVNIAFGAAVRATIPTNAPSSRRHPTMLRAALRDRALLCFSAITLAFYTIHMQSAVTLPIVIHHAGATPASFGLLLALDPLAVAVIQLLLQQRLINDNATATDRNTPPLRICAVGVATVGIGLAITGFGTSVTWFAATTPIWVAGEVIFLTVAPGIIAAMAPKHLRGLYYGIWGCCQGIAAIAAPLMAAALVHAGGLRLLWTSCAIAGLAAAAGCLKLNQAATKPASNSRQGICRYRNRFRHRQILRLEASDANS